MSYSAGMNAHFYQLNKLKTTLTERQTDMLMKSDWHWDKVIHTSRVSSDGHTLWSRQPRQSRQHTTHELMNSGKVCVRRWLSLLLYYRLYCNFSSWRVNLLLSSGPLCGVSPVVLMFCYCMLQMYFVPSVWAVSRPRIEPRMMFQW